MQHTAQALPKTAPEHQRAPLVTTAYELIKAIDEELQPGEEQLVAPIFMDLIASGEVKFISNRGPQTHHAA
jgi:hypothetical protein